MGDTAEISEGNLSQKCMTIWGLFLLLKKLKVIVHAFPCNSVIFFFDTQNTLLLLHRELQKQLPAKNLSYLQPVLFLTYPKTIENCEQETYGVFYKEQAIACQQSCYD